MHLVWFSKGLDTRGAHPEASGTASMCSRSKDGVSVIFDMGLSLNRMTNMIWRTLHHQQTLTTITTPSALQLGSPFAQY